MEKYGFTQYFEEKVLLKRPYLTKGICIKVVENPLIVERQEYNRYRFWGEIAEIEGKILRVVTLEDKLTIHNAFLDRRAKL